MSAMDQDPVPGRPAGKPLLTLAVPTYNRCAAAAENLGVLLAANLPPSVEILFIDNCSPDGTYEKLSAMIAGAPQKRVRLIRNESNIGVVRNVLKVFEVAHGDYVAVTSDEDPFVVDNIPALTAFLVEHRPDFVSSQVFKGKQLVRSMATPRRIRPEEFGAAAFYYSGLVFGTGPVREILVEVSELVSTPGMHYPHTVVAALLLSRDRGWWWDRELTRAVHRLPHDFSGEWFHVAGRWSQIKFFETFFSDQIARAADSRQRALFERMREAHRGAMHSWLRSGVLVERPDLIEFYDRGWKHRSFTERVLSRLSRAVRRPGAG